MDNKTTTWTTKLKALFSLNLPAVTISGQLSGLPTDARSGPDADKEIEHNGIHLTALAKRFYPGKKIERRFNKSLIGTATDLLGYVSEGVFYEIACYDCRVGYGSIDNPHYNPKEYGIRKTDNYGGWELIPDASGTFDREPSITEQARLDHAVAYIEGTEGYEDKVEWFNGLTQKERITK
ncbi:MAG: hypothetical protein CMM74_12830 [Rhodospirillaceae bacterium]|jgi:hypothetical protein|nr:hypothetical protein [Rhodospirillaceae bacterium]